MPEIMPNLDILDMLFFFSLEEAGVISWRRDDGEDISNAIQLVITRCPFSKEEPQ